MENNNKVQKGSTVKIIFLILFSLIMPTIAGVFIGVTGITEQATIYLIQFISILAGCLILILIIWKSAFNFQSLGFRFGHLGKWVIGLAIVELIPFATGFSRKLNFRIVAALILFMIAVGFFEEIIYRGLILQYLNKGNTKKAIALSAVLFGIGHIANVLGGADLRSTIGQIIFAVLFGIVCAEIVILTKSIMIGVVWHILHNIISSVTAASSDFEFVVAVVQCTTLIITSVALWRCLKKEELI